MNNEMQDEIFQGFRHCKICGYSASPDLVKESRKHFNSHTYKCSRCGWHPESMPTEKDARDAYNSRADKAVPEGWKILEKIEALIRQKKGFYSISVGHDEVKRAHKAGILKGLDVVHEEVKQAIANAEQKACPDCGGAGWYKEDAAPVTRACKCAEQKGGV